MLRRSEFYRRVGVAATRFRTSVAQGYVGSWWSLATLAAEKAGLPIDTSVPAVENKILSVVVHFRTGAELTKGEFFTAMAVLEEAWEYYEEKNRKR